jgi:hypothetical protein
MFGIASLLGQQTAARPLEDEPLAQEQPEGSEQPAGFDEAGAVPSTLLADMARESTHRVRIDPIERPRHRAVSEPGAVAPAPAAAPAPAPAPAPRGGAAAAHERALAAAGIAPALAAEIVRATVSHAVPFAPGRALKHLVRDALATRIPVVPAAAAPDGRTIVFVGAGGSGKTRCATRVAAAYDAASDLDVTLLDLSVRELAEPVDGRMLAVVDTPAVSPAAPADTRALARRLRRLGPCEIHVAVPATLSASAVRRLLDGLAPLKPAAIALTHLDEVDHAGPVIDEAIARGLPLSYCSDAGAVAPADPAALAARVLS